MAQQVELELDAGLLNGGFHRHWIEEVLAASRLKLKCSSSRPQYGMRGADGFEGNCKKSFLGFT